MTCKVKSMLIRQEMQEDYQEVYELVKVAFATTDFSDGSEPNYLDEVRKKACFLPELSLVAVKDNKIVGQIVMYQMQIKGVMRTEIQLVLSPISVHPKYFKQGIGSALIEEGCKRAIKMGYKAVFLCGNPVYYFRFGFNPTYKYNIYHVNDLEKSAEWCMVKELVEGYLCTVEGIIDIE